MKLPRLCFVFILVINWVLCESQSDGVYRQAYTPPRGWNSYDSFCWTISEEEFLQNADLVAKRLRPFGYEYVVVDYLWYRRLVEGAGVDSLGFDVIDEWGRMIPDPDRWPSSRGGNGFIEVANKVHSMGLKFGIHIMRGISTQAVNANTPILDITTGRAYEESGRQWYAKDIGIPERACAWMTHGFMSVNTKLGAGKAFLRSLYQQYADWGVDFVKHDCVFGDDLELEEISFASEVWRNMNRPIVYSLSPGTSVTPAIAKSVSGLVNMYRITADDWDSWQDVASHFDISRDFSAANMIGAEGLLGKAWPDLDMLPLGWLTDPGSNQGPHRKCNLSLDEQRTQMTLWSMAKSPLMFGGDMRNLDETTFGLLTNVILLDINAFSSNNREFPYISIASTDRHISNRGVNFRRRVLKDADSSKSLNLHLTSCMDGKAKGWFMRSHYEERDQVCWEAHAGSKQRTPFCLQKRAPSALDERKVHEKNYTGNFHLLANDTAELCLNASPSRKLTSKDFIQCSFSPCSSGANQLWEICDNVTLVSSYSGLCASTYADKANAIPEGIRSWIATGTKGDIFVAFFNLSPDAAVISAKISDLSNALPFRNSKFSSCSGREIWSGKTVRAVSDSLSISVEKHGCALFLLYCI